VNVGAFYLAKAGGADDQMAVSAGCLQSYKDMKAADQAYEAQKQNAQSLRLIEEQNRILRQQQASQTAAQNQAVAARRAAEIEAQKRAHEHRTAKAERASAQLAAKKKAAREAEEKQRRLQAELKEKKEKLEKEVARRKQAVELCGQIEALLKDIQATHV